LRSKGLPFATCSGGRSTLAKEENISIIILGTHCKTGAKHVFYGSVVEVDKTERRLSLVLAEHDAVKEQKAVPENYRQYTRKTQDFFGLLVDQLKDRMVVKVNGEDGR
jgi:hypothetical protein